MRALLVLTLLLVAGLAAAQDRAVKVPDPGGHPGGQGRAVQGVWSQAPAWPSPNLPNDVRLVDGTPVKIWLLLRAIEPVQSEVRLSGHQVDFNRTSLPLQLAAGQELAVPLTATARAPAGSHVSYQAEINVTAAGGQATDAFHASSQVLPAYSLRFVHPVPQYAVQPGGYAQPVPTNVGWQTPVKFLAAVENFGVNATAPITVSLHVHGRVVGSHTLTPVAPGERRNFPLGEFQLLRDMPEFAGYGTGSFSIGLDFQIATESADRGGPPAWAYSLQNGRLVDAAPQNVQVAFYSGVLAQAESVQVTLGKPSWIDISVANYGEETARNVRIDVRATPSPLAYYGPGTYLQETLYVTVAPAEVRHLNVTFVPRVAGAMQVSVQPFLPGYYAPITREFQLPTPLTVAPRENPATIVGDLGTTERITFVLNSSINLTGAEIAFAVSDDNAWRPGVPFARFITGPDLIGVSSSPTRVDLVDNRTVWVNATLDLRSAGVYRLIPYVKVGDLVYVGRGIGGGDGGGPRPVHPGEASTSGLAAAGGSYEVRINATPFSLARIWMPLAGVVVGFGGYWIWRSKAVL